eukprot:TRINITY_DN2859_c0_g1_i1.p1 TRINITY_DN2859_c0_g1~~TRINITY_DN2859_c0_g1_i1.p1  ORF type:complete len:312 (+),score=83.64 TRINITY_DN2859_c0_g1_i1:140-937(+)
MRASNGIFETIVSLGEGKHQYKFLVDGRWCYDILQPVVTDPLDNVNNEIDVSFFMGQQIARTMHNKTYTYVRRPLGLPEVKPDPTKRHRHRHCNCRLTFMTSPHLELYPWHGTWSLLTAGANESPYARESDYASPCPMRDDDGEAEVTTAAGSENAQESAAPGSGAEESQTQSCSDSDEDDDGAVPPPPHATWTGRWAVDVLAGRVTFQTEGCLTLCGIAGPQHEWHQGTGVGALNIDHATVVLAPGLPPVLRTDAGQYLVAQRS